jgi:hypothetical protein
VDEVKGLSVLVTYDPSELTFVSASLVEELVSPLGDLFFWSGDGEDAVQLDLAVLGKGATLGGSGEVALLAFAPVADTYSLGLDAVKLRDAENRPLTADVEGYHSVPTVPSGFRLLRNAPNPFRRSTRIAYDVPREAQVSIRVYDVSGRLVRTLVDGVVDPGCQVTAWDARNDGGEPVSSGVYFCTMHAGGYRGAHKIILLD